ncbi:MAG: metallophosphoesterase, partial [Candidatus Thermoplasmatota archaeon]|nr:metallophosphoesterase [Candidatus Thermoplasmatota archaeon]
MSCKLDLPLGPSFRDAHIEADLQGRLDEGRRVWAIGDIHGHLGTFRALIHCLKLDAEDRVVCLGDMIDRGPDSAGLIDYIRSHPQIICLKGNHELMAITSLQEDGHVELWQP